MLKKYILIMMLIVLFIPLNVKAGIICNDGWESSCTVSGPGCCSHHGGVAGNANNSSNYITNKNNDNDKSGFAQNLSNEKYAEILVLIIIGIPILIGIFGKDESKPK